MKKSTLFAVLLTSVLFRNGDEITSPTTVHSPFDFSLVH